MDVIKKIAITSSIILFSLAQIFSFSVIYQSHKEKIELLTEKEEKIFLRYSRALDISLRTITYKDEFKDYVITYYFRKTMPENTALY